MITSQDHNPITGDTQLNPSSFGLNMSDINNENLKTLIMSGNVSLTSDQYREMERISYSKFGKILPSDIDQTNKDPGLYMSNQYLGFWDGSEWRSYVNNSGDCYFGDTNLDNYMQWSSLDGTLKIRGDIEASSITATAISAIDLDASQITTGTIDADRINIGYLETIDMDTLADDPGWTPPQYGVVIDNDGITGYNQYTESFRLDTATGKISSAYLGGVMTVPDSASKIVIGAADATDRIELGIYGGLPRITLYDDDVSCQMYYNYVGTPGLETEHLIFTSNIGIQAGSYLGSTSKATIRFFGNPSGILGALYVKDSDNNLYYKPEGGVEVKLN